MCQDCGDIRGIFTRSRESQGFIILAFYDCRQMPRAKQILDSQTFFGNIKLSAEYVRSSYLNKVGQLPFFYYYKYLMNHYIDFYSLLIH